MQQVRRIGVRIAVVVVALIALSSTLGSFRKTPADQIALSYGGGPLEGNQFQRVVDPGSTLQFNGLFDHWYEYPVTQRNYIISRRPDEGDVGGGDGIASFTSDKSPVTWEIAVYFKLNTSKVRAFHEAIGLKYQAWTEDGWAQMLNDSFRQQIEFAVQTESRRHDVEELLSEPDAILDVQKGVARNLKDRVAGSLGDDYFCGPTYQLDSSNCPDFTVTVKKPNFSDEIVKAYQDQKVSAAEVQSARNRADAAEAEGQGVDRQRQALQGSLTPEFIEYLRAQAMADCAKNPNCKMVITSDGTNVNVNTD